MRKRAGFLQIILLFLVMLFPVSASAADGPSEKLNFNQGWKFVRQNIQEAIQVDYPMEELERWESVDLPHTVRVEPYNNSGGVNYQGEAMYRKHFKLPESYAGKKLYIKFEGVMGVTDVWVNGEHMQGKMAAKTGENTQYGGYLPFVLDVTEAVHCDDTYNVITVLTDNRDNETVPPGKPQSGLDFTYFGGVYRNVWLEVKEQVHITDAVYEDIIAGGGILVEYPEVSDTRAKVAVKTHVRNESAGAKTVTLKTELIDADGKTAAENSRDYSIPAAGDYTFEQELFVTNPELWNLDRPYLYRLVSTVLVDGEETDVQETKIGIRKITVSKEEGLKINGEEMPYLSGVNRHQEYPYVGYAASANMQRRDAIKFKEGGFNIVRTSHTPQSLDFIEACDELGILVMECVPGWQHWSGDERFAARVKNDVQQMVRRTRNHPSILCYEISLNETSGLPSTFTNECNAVAKAEHPELITSAENPNYGANSDILYGTLSEVAGWSDTAVALIREYADYWQEQYGDFKDNARVTRGPGSYYPGGEGAMEKQAQNNLWSGFSFDGTGALSLAQGMERHKENKRFVGAIKWIGIDHNRGYVDNMSPCGVWDLMRLPKYSYYAYESQRDLEENTYLEAKGIDTGASIFIASSWGEKAPIVDKTGVQIGTDSDRTIHVYSNADKVKLSAISAAGAVLWEKTQEPYTEGAAVFLAHPPYIFEGVPYTAGSYLRAEGLDKSGAVIMTKEVHTAGEPKKLELKADFCGMDLTADGSDQVMVYAYVLDENGNVCQQADNKLYFSVEGEGSIVGDGDRRVGANPINAEAGITGIILQSTKTAGEVKVKVRAEGLEEKEISITTAPMAQKAVEYEAIAQGSSMEYSSAFLADKEEIIEGNNMPSIEKKTVTTGGETYEKSLEAQNGLHISYDLGGHYSRFTAKASLEDSSRSPEGAVFKVYADGVLVFMSDPVTDGVVEIEADISGCRTLTLVAEDFSGINTGNMRWLSPYIYEGTTPADESELKENLAAGRTATASSTDEGTSTDAALDGDMTTLWRSGESVEEGKPQSWIVDLGYPMDVRNTRLAVEHDYLKCTYNIYTSTDKKKWKLQATGAKTGHGNGLEDSFTAENVQYVKVEFTKVESTQGDGEGREPKASIKEFEIYPDKGVKTVKDYNLKGILIAGKDVVFSPEQTEYSLKLDGFEKEFYVKALPSNLDSAVTVNGTEIPKALESDMDNVGYCVTELTGDREIMVEVTSPDGKGAKKYTFHFEKGAKEKIYDAVKCFVPGVNGANGWSYQQKNGDSFEDMKDETFTAVKGEYAWSGDNASDWIYSGPRYMHPGENVKSVRTFTAPEDGIIRYQADVDRISGQWGATRVALMKNGTKIWPEEWDDWTLWENGSVDIDVSLAVREGDKLQLVLDCQTDGNGGDGTGALTTVSYLDGTDFVITGKTSLVKNGAEGISEAYILEPKTGKFAEALDFTWRLKEPAEGVSISQEGILTITGTAEAEKVVIQAVYGDTVIAEKTVRRRDSEDAVWLSDLDWKSESTVGYGEIQKNKSSDGNQIRLIDADGQEAVYEKGLGTHAPSEIIYDIADMRAQGYNVFQAMVGADYEVHDHTDPGMEFKIFFDNDRETLAYSSGEMYATTPQKEVCIPIPEDAGTVTLWVDDLGLNYSDHGDWADAKLVKAARADMRALETVMEQAEAKLTGEYTEELLNALRGALNNAERVKNDIFTTQEEVDAACTELTEAYEAIGAEEAANREAAGQVEAEIQKIGEVTLESKAAIEAARGAYEALTAPQKKLVANLSELKRAETIYAALKKADDAEKGRDEEVEAVIEKIQNIGTVTLESKTKIDEARNAYDALSDEQKELVTNYEVLTQAETAYAELSGAQHTDINAAKSVMEKIEAIGEVTLDSKDKITGARAAYDALTSTQKEFVTNYTLLEKAEMNYRNLEQAEEERQADEKAAWAVIERIQNIGTVTLDSKDALTEARAAYDALTDAQKKLVKNFGLLTKAEAEYRKLENPESPNKPEGLKKGGVCKAGKLYYKVLSVEKAEVTVLKPVKKTEKAIKIPNTVKLNGVLCKVTQISKNAFKNNKKLTKVTIGKHVQVIGKNAFNGDKKLKKIVIKSKNLKKAYASSIKGISKKAVIDVPNKKIKAYRKLFGIKGNSKIKVK